MSKSVDIIHELVLKKYPDYDFERHTFVDGDLVSTLDGAVIIVRCSALAYVDGYVYKPSFKYHNKGEVRVPYSDLPYYKQGEFKSLGYNPIKSLKWRVGDIVKNPTYGTVGYLFKECDHQRFYMYVLETDNDYYMHTGVYIENPYACYITC